MTVIEYNGGMETTSHPLVTRDESLALTSKEFRQSAPKRRYVNRRGFGFYELNAYALWCGYIQQVQNGTTRTLQLWHESDHYHVRYTDYDRKPAGRESELPYVHSVGDAGFYQYWMSFTDLKTAREVFHGLLSDVLPVYVDILGHYGNYHANGRPVWDVVTCEPSRPMARETVKTYQENEPNACFKIREYKEVQNAE